MAIECIVSLGLKIPDDVAMVSFDNADAYKICISCGGPLDSKKGRIYSPPNLPGWDNVPIVEILSKNMVYRHLFKTIPMPVPC